MPPPEPQNTGPRPNPFRDAGPFGQIEIGGVLVPGIIQSVGDYTVKQDWNFQKAGGGGAKANEANPDPANAPAAAPAGGGTGNVRQATPPATQPTGGGTAGSFGVSVWRGALLVEEAEIVSVITDPDREVAARMYDAALDFMLVVLPKRGRKPPSLSLVNPDANAVGVTRCAIREIATPREEKPGSGKYVFKFKICEYNPQKTAAAGKADPAKPGEEPKPADAAEKQLQDLLNKARQ